MRPKWNGKDWRERRCDEWGECGYASKKKWCILHHCRFSLDNRACPDFEPRNLLAIPDPEITDERSNLNHIREDDRQ